MAPVPALSVLSLLTLTIVAAPAEGQILGRLKNAVTEAKGTVTDARDIRCEVQGQCGEIWQSPLFAPGQYQSLAVTVFDASGGYRGQKLDGMVRSPFEGKLLENGFMLAASANADVVRERIGRSPDAWTDAELAQLKDFVEGIDAVLVLQIESALVAQCRLEDTLGTEVTVHLSARFLNVDAGDIPWVGKHTVTVCKDGGVAALTAALEKVSSQLAGSLPTLK